MPANIVTTEDLKQFKKELLLEIKELLIQYEKITIDKWIKSNKVMDKLEISPGTLQNFRIKNLKLYTFLLLLIPCTTYRITLEELC